MSRELSNWIDGYIEYTLRQESPEIFHRWGAIALIAGSLGRRVWINYGYFTLFPNFYIILVAPTGVGRKSSAITIGEGILEGCEPFVKIMRGQLSKPYLADWLVKAMKDSPYGFGEVFVVVSEWKVFAQGVMSDNSLLEALTDLYDCKKFEYKTKHSGIYIVPLPCANLYAASTPEWLTTGRAADFIGGGFSSRIIPIGVKVNERSIGWPDKGKREFELEGLLKKDLIEISQLNGEILITPEAKKVFLDWYEVRYDDVLDDARLVGYYSKKHDKVLKLSAILAVAESDNLIISVTHIHQALNMLTEVERSMQFAYSGVAWGESAKHTNRVYNEIERRGEVDHSQLVRIFQLYMNGQELRVILNTLCEAELIGWRAVPTKTRSKTVYFPTGKWKKR